MTTENLPEDLLKALFEYSPRVEIDQPILLPWAQSQTGWLIIEPKRKDYGEQLS